MSDPANLCRCGGKGKCLWCAIARGLEQGPFFDVAKEPWLERIRGVPSPDSIPEEHRMSQPGPLSNVAFDEMVGPDGTTRDVDAAIAAAGPREKVTWTFKNGNKLVFAPPLPGDAGYRGSYNTRSWDLASDIPAEDRYTMHTRHSDGTLTEMELTRAQYEKVKATMARLAPPEPADDYEALGYPETEAWTGDLDGLRERFYAAQQFGVYEWCRWWRPATDKKNDSDT